MVSIVFTAAASTSTISVVKNNGEPEQTDSISSLGGALPGTDLLDRTETIQPVGSDPGHVIDRKQYDQVSRYLSGRIAATPSMRDKGWQPDFSSLRAYDLSVEAHRLHLQKMLGLVDLAASETKTTVLAKSRNEMIESVKITFQSGPDVRALLFIPHSRSRQPVVIAIPDADQSAEEFAGIAEGTTPAQWLRNLLGRGVAVAIPVMVERRADHALCLQSGGHDRRRMLWRLGFLVGRTLVGLEVQQVMALSNYLFRQPNIDGKKIGVWGVGQGGMTALYAAAVDRGLASVTVQDYFQQREQSWREPVDRVLYGQLNEFGDAEVSALVAPRPLTVVSRQQGEISSKSVQAEVERAQRFYLGLHAENKLAMLEVSNDALSAGAIAAASMLGAKQQKAPLQIEDRVSTKKILEIRNEHFEALYRYLRRLCVKSDSQRTAYWKLAMTAPQDRQRKVTKLRAELQTLMGEVPDQNIPLHPRTLLIGKTDKFLAYEVVLDTVPGVEAYGHLLVPRVAPENPRKLFPAIVCQHGFGGAPKFVSGIGTDIESNDHFYHRFGERLAERGYVVFAPYITVPADSRPPGELHRADLINPIVRKAASLGMMRTSIELAKLHRIVDFLQSLPFVERDRIGYYGLSYGGYSAIWMPPLEPRLKFTVVSGHFNDQEEKLIAYGKPGHLWNLPDEDFYNWNLLNRFTHSELIAAMWPRPVSIEWGLYDPTTTPEWHNKAAEYLKKNYVIPWEMQDKVAFDDYIGPHTIHGIDTFSFIDRWLKPEQSAKRDYGCDGENYCYQNAAPGFHGYLASSENPYVTHLVDSSKNSVIRGSFYVSSISPEFVGMKFRISRMGHPGDLVVKLGSRPEDGSLGELHLGEHHIQSIPESWYELKLDRPIRLNPQVLYWFEVTSPSGQSGQDGYTFYGPKPLGGTDYPMNFGLSFQVMTKTP
jgi:dienelactone hydrolase